eukprot:TRINITY_DN45106_c0_g1_i1.p1 TRINITY_DN45106_c0_g1~~TRINITY_DN45106_c0_g1_i1.p1  ORF type:complete len:272 (-),score=52.67 TRINITY_DN45106_c0_g1_i1:52-867(-)
MVLKIQIGIAFAVLAVPECDRFEAMPRRRVGVLCASLAAATMTHSSTSFSLPGRCSRSSKCSVNQKGHYLSMRHRLGRRSRLARPAAEEGVDVLGMVGQAFGLIGQGIQILLGGYLLICIASAIQHAQRTEEQKKAMAAIEAKLQADKEARRKRAYIAPQEKPWTDEELAAYDGSKDEDGPILIACDGKVYNVWQGAHFYAPGCEYHALAGRDATRLLAKNQLEEESEESLKKALNLAEQASLEIWKAKFAKYDVVGTYAGSKRSASTTAS